MWGRLQAGLAIAICVAIFITFLAHKPACSAANRLHNKPVPTFKALSADTDVKSGIGAVVETAVTRPMVAPASPQLEGPAPAVETPQLGATRFQVLSFCLLC
jgi:hypothetical protein